MAGTGIFRRCYYGVTIVVVSLLVPPSQHVLEMHKIEKDKTLDDVSSKEELVDR